MVKNLQISNISWFSLVLRILWAITKIQYFLIFIGFVNSLSHYKYPIFLDFHWFCEFSEPLQISNISWFSLVLWTLWAITNIQYFLIFTGFVNSLSHYKDPIFLDFHWFCEFSEPLQRSNISWFSLVLWILWAITNTQYFLIFIGFVNSLSHYKYQIFPDFHWFCEFSEPLKISNISWISLVLWILWANQTVTNEQNFWSRFHRRRSSQQQEHYFILHINLAIYDLNETIKLDVSNWCICHFHHFSVRLMNESTDITTSKFDCSNCWKTVLEVAVKIFDCYNVGAGNQSDFRMLWSRKVSNTSANAVVHRTSLR